MTRVYCPCGRIFDYFGHDVYREYCPDCIEVEERYQASGPRYSVENFIHAVADAIVEEEHKAASCGPHNGQGPPAAIRATSGSGMESDRFGRAATTDGAPAHTKGKS